MNSFVEIGKAQLPGGKTRWNEKMRDELKNRFAKD
jgi:hypothetical protein